MTTATLTTRERASLGGQALVKKYGRDEMVRRGKLGGRPSWQQELERDKALRAQARKRNGRRVS